MKPATLSQKVFARFLRGSDDLNHRMYAARKNALFKEVHGRVFEIGPGTGVNLGYYPSGIHWTGIEPNPVLHPVLREKARELNIAADVRTVLDEAVREDKGRADFVISTMVLCSVNDLAGTLRSVRDLLKPGGRFLFLEHVVDHANPVRRFIQRSAPYTPWRFFSDGCDPGRDIAAAIAAAGFTHVDCRHYLQAGPGLIAMVNRPHIYGHAVK
ncbi:MAG: class I SAM-dependent methyltransferase [Candidatus Omnitrophica bacterium]|nr:class I SAM-dependent methyltransferase [Candidatus Omnitrophota bacterium]MCB9721478.1 class I SAM-dependent methyltransferase [Candidatus Omnitrophota bacterium]